MKKALLIILIFLSQVGIYSIAENPRDEEGWVISPISVNGLKVLGKYSKGDMIKALGVPSNIIDTIVEGTHLISFMYQNDEFSLEDGRFTSFCMRNKNSRFFVNESVKPGSKMTVLLKMLAENANGIGLPETVTSESGHKYIHIDVVKNFDAGYILFWYSNDTIDSITLDHID